MSKGARSARAAGKVSVAVFLSRILGLVREQVFAKLFGAGIYMDSWLVAFRIPNLLRDLFAEGALSSAFVPTFTDCLEKQGQKQAWHLANLVLSLLMVLLGALSILFLVFSEWFVTLIAAGYGAVPGKVEITSTLIQILSPFLLLVALASVAMGILNTLNHYFLPALAPAFFNLALIVSGLWLAPRFEDGGVLPIYAMGVGALLGGALQFAVQLPLLWREGFHFRFRLDLSHPGIIRIRRLLGPAVLGASAVQINILVNTQLASFLQDNGPVSWLSYAFRIIYLPIGLFGVAVGVVNLKEVSVFAARQQWDGLKETVANSLKLIAFLAIPSMAGLIVLAGPIVDVLFERGDFTARDTLFTSYAVMAYSVGLFVYSSVKVYVPTFYALNDTRTPVRASMIAVGANILLNLTLILILPRGYKFVGLALGTSCAALVNSWLLATGLRRRLGHFKKYAVGTTILRTVFASALMGAGVYLIKQSVQPHFPDPTLGQELAALGALVVAGVAVYFFLCRLLGVEEASYVVSILRGSRR